MPGFLVPRRVSAHRVAVKALYRALLFQSRASPLSQAQRNELQNIIRNRFRQARHDHSHQRLRFNLQAGYEAIDHLDASVAGDHDSTAYLCALLERAPEKVKQPPPLRKLSIKRIEKIDAEEEAQDVPADGPYVSILNRPVPLEKLSGKRHVPRLFSAGGIPVLRIKKPQPKSLSRYLTQRLRQKDRRQLFRRFLEERKELAKTEDTWDEILHDTASGADVYNKSSADGPSWVMEINRAHGYVHGKLSESLHKNKAMATKMQAIVDKEQALLDAEQEEERRAKTEMGQQEPPSQEALKLHDQSASASGEDSQPPKRARFLSNITNWLSKPP